MVSAPAPGGRPEAPLWEFVRLADYRPPRLPARNAAAKVWASARRWFRPVEEDSRAPARKEAELRALPLVRLEHLVRAIDWTDAAAVLDATIAESMQQAAPDPPISFVVGQPHCAHAEILRGWAARRDARVIEPPTLEQVLAGGADWLDAWPAPGSLWVMPCLERCYLRHVRGLALVRELLERAAGGGSGGGLIGCDSWAWAYLQRVIPVARFEALTLQAFDGPRLARLFARLASPRGGGTLSFRNARTGNEVLCSPLADDEASPELEQLAAHCRGNFATARAYWRKQLRSEPEDEDKCGADPGEVAAGGSATRDEIVWVSAALEGSASPLEADEDTALVLHALLLHDGLPASLLPELLPLPAHRSTALLLRLQSLGITERRGERWAVAALGYAIARELLRGRDFLTDDF